MLFVYALTLFISALLLFLVQPLIGKLIVPLMGGFPSVWNTCMVFFQAMLLAGYTYAHFTSSWLGVRKQAILHVGLLILVAVAVGLFRLQVFRDLVPSSEDNVVQLVFGLLLLLLASAGLPFFAVSATAPLLQRWFANTDHPAARDPYFLYAASNIGSMMALLAYPAAIEPELTLFHQRLAWSVGFAVLVLLIAACAVLLRRSLAPAPGLAVAKGLVPVPAPASDAITTTPTLRRFAIDFAGPSLAVALDREKDEITLGRALRWVALAFVPSSFMLGVTTYITTDIAAIPLLWILPLALYLLSFILVFSQLPPWVHKLVVLAMPVLLLLLIFFMLSHYPAHMWALILLHVVVLFFVAMVCHGELARTRPAARQLTKFYLLMSVGGVLGGLFNALLAPVLFTSLAEYRVVIVLAALLLPRLDDPTAPTRWRTRWLDVILPLGLGLISLEFFGLRPGEPFPASNWLLRQYDHMVGQDPGDAAREIVGYIHALGARLHVGTVAPLLILHYAPPIFLAYLLVERPLRFGLGVAALLFAGSLPALLDPAVIYRTRSFFGILNVKQAQVTITVNGEKKTVESHSLLHGNILHGEQYRGDPYRLWAITYYYHNGPIGQIFKAFEGDAAKRNVAVIGLGTGTMAAYAQPGDHYTFYEIDRKVKETSFDQKTYFSFVQDAKERGADVNIVLGDARLSLDRERQTNPDQKYDLIVVDAFSSDAIPVHLLTQQALQIYRAKLKPGGIVVFHTSNRYLDLEPVVGNIAAAEGMACIMQSDTTTGAENPGKLQSTWVLVANQETDFGKLLDGDAWRPQRPDPSCGVWTDDFSNLLQVFRWRSSD
jgi:SAM-dependent methyltransferase